MSTDLEGKKIVIIGGGIIGCTTAYFLTRHPSFNPNTHSVTLLESTKIAGGASGKAGGLLALWAYPANLVPLSFRLHAELAKEHGGDKRWGYRRIGCGQLDAKVRAPPASVQQTQVANSITYGATSENESISLQKRSEAALDSLSAAGIPADLDWVAADSVLGFEEMGGPDTTAQVHPYLFTSSMAALAKDSGAKILEGARVTGIDSDTASNTVMSVTYHTGASEEEIKTIPATDIVVAAGPWTSHFLPQAPISGLRAHSVTIRPKRTVSAYALFTSIDLPAGFSPHGSKPLCNSKTVTPEIYARPNDEVYACGEGDTLVPLPDTTAEVKIDDQRCQDIIDHVGAVSDELREGEVTARQACYLPVCEGGGGPWIGETGKKGVYVASGHSCWGIQNAPATGKVISEIMMGGKAESVKLGRLDARRIMG